MKTAAIAPADRRPYYILGAAIAALFILMILYGTASPDDQFPSSDSAASGGAKAAYTLLQRLGYSPERWIRPPSALPSDARDVVWVLAEPSPAMGGYGGDDDLKAIDAFLEHGGRILAVGSGANLLLPSYWPPIAAMPDEQGQLWLHPYSALEPGGLTAGAPSIRMLPGFGFDIKDGPAAAVYGQTSGPPQARLAVVASETVADGRIVFWSAADPLTNYGLTQPGNLELLLNSVGPHTRRVLWDEYYHGERAGLAREVVAGWKYGAFPLGILIFVLLWTFARRSGPVWSGVSVRRDSPLEFTQHLGGLYERAGAAPSALAVFARTAARALRSQAGGAPPGSDAAQLLSQAESAAAGPVKETRALELARRLQELVDKARGRSVAPEPHP